MAAARMKPAETPLAWRKRQGAKAGDAPVQRSQLPEDADFTTKLAALRHSVESKGVSWNGPISRGTAMELILFLSHETKGEFKSLVEILQMQQKQIAGMQAKVDHVDKHALTYSGEWQPTSTYYPGNAVSHKGQLYTALKHVIPGKSAPSSRDGSGWALMV